MKNVWMIVSGAVFGVGLVMILGFTASIQQGRYQLVEAKAMQQTADGKYVAERPVCFWIDTQTGQTCIYAEQSLVGLGGKEKLVDRFVPIFHDDEIEQLGFKTTKSQVIDVLVSGIGEPNKP